MWSRLCFISMVNFAIEKYYAVELRAVSRYYRWRWGLGEVVFLTQEGELLYNFRNCSYSYVSLSFILTKNNYITIDFLSAKIVYLDINGIQWNK